MALGFRIHGMFVRRKPLVRRHEFAETPQPANFARRISYARFHPSAWPKSEPKRSPGQKTDQQHAHENCGTDRGKAAAPLHQRRRAGQE